VQHLGQQLDVIQPMNRRLYDQARALVDTEASRGRDCVSFFAIVVFICKACLILRSPSYRQPGVPFGSMSGLTGARNRSYGLDNDGFDFFLSWTGGARFRGF